MWRKEHKIWTTFCKDIIATDAIHATFLQAYREFAKHQGTNFATSEIIDLQRYKIVKKKEKVQSFFRLSKTEPFIFFVSKN